MTLVYVSWPKIVAPMAQSGFDEFSAFHPGWLWLPLLSALQFFGGVLSADGPIFLQGEGAKDFTSDGAKHLADAGSLANMH